MNTSLSRLCRRFLRRTLLVLAVSWLACVEADMANRVAVTERDSSGISIIEFDTALVGNRWALSDASWSRSEVLVGGEPHPLSDVVDVEMLDDSTIVMAEGSTGRLFIGPLDNWVGVGGRGEGPFEFARLWDLEPAPEGVFALDLGRLRIVAFTAAGEPISEPQVLPSFLTAVRGWVAEDGSHLLLYAETFAGPGEEGMFRGAAPLVRIMEDHVDTLALLNGIETFRGLAGSGTPLVPGLAYLAPSRRGIWTADSQLPEVVRRDVEGRIRAIARWKADSNIDVEAQAGRVIDQLVADLPEAQRRTAMNMLSDVPAGSKPSHFSDLRATELGGVWIGPYRPQVTYGLVEHARRFSGRPWIAIDSAGTPEALVSVPLGFEPRFIGADFTLGVYTNSLGAESLQRREIIRE